MICRHRDPELLLLYHAELPLWRRAYTQVHLTRCARCRARLEDFACTSRLLARALPGPSFQQPAERLCPASRYARRRALLPTFALLALLAFLTALAAATLLRPAHCGNEAPTNGCLPRLPSDRCR